MLLSAWCGLFTGTVFDAAVSMVWSVPWDSTDVSLCEISGLLSQLMAVSFGLRGMASSGLVGVLCRSPSNEVLSGAMLWIRAGGHCVCACEKRTCSAQAVTLDV